MLRATRSRQQRHTGRMTVTFLRLLTLVSLGLLLTAGIQGETAGTATAGTVTWNTATLGAATADTLEFLGADRPVRAISYEFPSGVWPNTLPPLCALARDLPLIAETGATVVVTDSGVPDDGDHIFLSLLASTRLGWVVRYPPSAPGNGDGVEPLATRRQQVLEQFTTFSRRYAGNRNLRGILLDFEDEDVASVASLPADLRQTLASYFPAGQPLIGMVARSPLHLDLRPVDLDFWVYRFDSNLPTNSNRLQLTTRTPLPVIFDLSDVAQWLLLPETAPAGSLQASWRDYLSLFQGGDFAQPVLSLRFLSDLQTHSSVSTASSNGATTTILSHRHRSDALFVGERDSSLMENLSPTLFGRQQREAWQAEAFEDHAEAPRLEAITNAATSGPEVSPGTRVGVAGKLFQLESETRTDAEWPLHLGANCLCVANRPAPLGSLSDTAMQAQLPWVLGTGDIPVRVIREGVSSAPLQVSVQQVSPGIFADGIERSDTDPTASGSQNLCNVGAGNGVRTGEMLSLKVTGSGMLNGSTEGLRVLLDGTEAEILSAALTSEEPGIAKVRIRVPPARANSSTKGLYLRHGNQASNLLAVSYAGAARPTVGLVASAAGIQVQQEGVSAAVEVETQGLNGYCGPVDFEVMGLPNGVTAEISPVVAGETALLRLRASSIAAPIEAAPIYLYAIPSPGDLQLLSLELTVLPRISQVTISATSAGYGAGGYATIAWNGTTLAPTGESAPRGIYMLVVNPQSGVFSPVEHFDVYASEAESDRLQGRLLALPTATIVAMAIADDGTNSMTGLLRAHIMNRLGSNSIMNLGYQHSWAIIGAIGRAPAFAESAESFGAVTVNTTLELPSS